VSALFFLSLERQREKTKPRLAKEQNGAEEGWQGVSESAESAKRGWVWFGAKPAQSETPVRAAAKRRPPGRGEVGKKKRSRLEVGSTLVVLERDHG